MDKAKYISKAHTKIGRQYFLDTTIFPGTGHTGYAKMITLWGFFVFVTTFCTGFTRTEKQQIKETEDGIYNRIINLVSL